MKDIKIEFSNKEITPWGALVLLKKMLERIDFSGVINHCEDLPKPGSNRGYAPVRVIESFFAAV